MSREQNRADFPKATEMFDEIRATYPDARVLWASENGREIGRRPELESNWFEVGSTTFDLLREHNQYVAKRAKR